MSNAAHLVMIDGEPYYKCKFCDKKERPGSKVLATWMMQHFHFEDGDLDFLTCALCRNIPPTDMLAKLKAEGMN